MKNSIRTAIATIIILATLTIFMQKAEGSMTIIIDGDWIITGEEGYTGVTIILNGNLTLEENASLTLNKVIFKFGCEYDRQYLILTKANSSFTAIETNITTTSNYSFNEIIIGGEGIFENSKIEKSYYGIEALKNSSVIVKNTEITDGRYGIISYSYTTIENATIKNMNSTAVYGIGTSLTMKNAFITNVFKGFYIASSKNASLYNITIVNNNGTAFHAFDSTVYIYNSTIMNNTGTGILADKNSTVKIENSLITQNKNNGVYSRTVSFLPSSISLINTTVSSNSPKNFALMGNSSISSFWFMQVKVVDWRNSNSTNATVIAKDEFGKEVFNGTTDENGETEKFVCQEFLFNQSFYTYYNYTIFSTKEFYTAKNTTTDVKENKLIIIKINSLPIPVISSPNYATGNETILFKSLSYDKDGFILNYTWNFGEGTIKYGQIVNHAFSLSGIYNISLTVSDDGFAVNNTFFQILINIMPTCFASANPSITISMHNISFTAIGYDVDGNISIYEWDFNNDGNYEFSSSFSGNTTYAYQKSGVYTAVLRVRDNLNATAIAEITIIINNALPTIVSAKATPNTAYKNQTIIFTGNASDVDGKITKYEWDFNNDGNYEYSSNSTANTQFTYNQSGIYLSTLRITDDENGATTSSLIITILNKLPSVEIFADKTNAFANEIINFNVFANDEDGYIANYTWYFGDGEFAFGQMQNHSYFVVGNYVITVEVSDNENAVVSKSIAIKIEQPKNILPIISISSSSNIVYANQIINFIGNAFDIDGSISLYEWDFNSDGVYEFSSTESGNANYSYSKIGIYFATFKATDNRDGISSASLIIEVVNPLPIIELNANRTFAYIDDGINFSASVSDDGFIKEIRWDFNTDGVYEFIQELNKSSLNSSIFYKYSEQGFYDITFFALDNLDGIATAKISVFIVEKKNEKPIAKITAEKTNVPVNASIYFSANDSRDDGKIVRYTWYFGDLEKSGKNVFYAFENAGVFVVRLGVVDDDGEEDFDTILINVIEKKNEKPNAKITAEKTNANISEEIEFNAVQSTDDGQIIGYIWEINGEEKPGEIITYSFSNSGIYFVKLTVMDDKGETDDDSIWISIEKVENKKPIAKITTTKTTVFANESITFNALSSYDFEGDIVKYEWTMGNTDKKTSPYFSYRYPLSGVYTVKLTVTDENNATDSDFITIIVEDVKSYCNSPLVSKTNYFTVSWGANVPNIFFSIEYMIEREGVWKSFKTNTKETNAVFNGSAYGVRDGDIVYFRAKTSAFGKTEKKETYDSATRIEKVPQEKIKTDNFGLIYIPLSVFAFFVCLFAYRYWNIYKKKRLRRKFEEVMEKKS